MICEQSIYFTRNPGGSLAAAAQSGIEFNVSQKWEFHSYIENIERCHNDLGERCLVYLPSTRVCRFVAQSWKWVRIMEEPSKFDNERLTRTSPTSFPPLRVSTWAPPGTRLHGIPGALEAFV